jgi:hypothetical protein
MTQLQGPIHLEFSNNSIRRTTAQVDSLGIFYSVSREDDRIISVRRWDQRTNAEILIGQINFRLFAWSLIRFGGEEKPWSYIYEFLRREHGFFLNLFVSFLITTSRPDALSSARTFTGSNGTDYRWCVPWNKLMVGRPQCSMERRDLTLAQLCPANGDTKHPLARYHHNIFSEKSYIEIFDKSLLDTLDLVISMSTCILAYRLTDDWTL